MPSCKRYNSLIVLIKNLLKINITNFVASFFRERNRLKFSWLEETESAWLKEDFVQMGRELWRLFREDRFYQEDSRTEAKVRERRALSCVGAKDV